MKTWKKLLLLLVTLLLLAAGAFLPKLSAMLADRDFLNLPGSRDMKSVVLELFRERSNLITVIGKIELLRSCGTIPITEREASMTEEEAYAALERQMQAYIDAGIVEWFDATLVDFQPNLCMDPEEPEQYGIFWYIDMVNERAPHQSLNVVLDDDTGKIYSICYNRPRESPSGGISERNFAVMEAFTQIYVGQLELFPSDSGAEVEPALEYYGVQDDVLCGGFSVHGEYGWTRLEFYVSEAGDFYVRFPE